MEMFVTIDSIKKRYRQQPASPREYVLPFLRRYRRLFWFDGILAALRLPFLVWLVFSPTILTGSPIRINGWATGFMHVSIAAFGILANILLLRHHPFGPLTGYLKAGYAIGLRLIILWRLGLDWPIDPSAALLPLLLILVGYQLFYAWCIHMNTKWREKLRRSEATRYC